MNFFANTGAVSLSIRGASEADLDRIVEIHTACYPDDRTAAQRRLNLTQNGLGRFEDLRVAVRDGQVVGHGFGFSIVTRGAGIGKAIVAHLEQKARRRGACLAMLSPFRHGFYRALGYADVTPMRRLFVDPRAVPRAWVDAARSAPLRAARASDVPRLVALHQRSARRALGWTDRPESLWTRLLARERLHFTMLDKRGYVAFEVLQREAHARTHIDVKEMVADSPDTRRLLWGLLGSQAGQVVEIEIEVADDDPIAFALTDIDGARHGDERVEHDFGCIVAGPMLRMLDVEAALEARGYTHEGDLALSIGGKRLHLRARKGRATLLRKKVGDALVTDARTLASIAFGGLAVKDAADLGLAQGKPATLARANALFHTPPFTTLDRF
jgi:predicted acetyltransferase